MIAHALPGRIRLRQTRPLSQTALDELARRIRALAPSANLQHSPLTGSTLICFAEREKSAEVLTLFAFETRPLSKVIKPARHYLCWPSMRQIKRGMGVSLVASLGLLAVRRENGHAATGGIFLGLLARHLWVYRKRLWK